MGTEGVGPSKRSEGRCEGSGVLRGERGSPKRRCDPGLRLGTERSSKANRDLGMWGYIGKNEALGSNSKSKILKNK